jgi:hypothetical protein
MPSPASPTAKAPQPAQAPERQPPTRMALRPHLRPAQAPELPSPLVSAFPAVALCIHPAVSVPPVARVTVGVRDPSHRYCVVFIFTRNEYFVNPLFFPKTNFPGIPLRNSAKVLAMALRPLPRREPWGTGAGCFVLLVWCFYLSVPCAKHGRFVSDTKRGRFVSDAGRGIRAHRARQYATLTVGARPMGATGGVLAHRAKRRATLTMCAKPRGAAGGILTHSASLHATPAMGAWPMGATGGVLARRARHRATAACAVYSRIAAFAGGEAMSWATRGSAGRIATFAGGGG